MNRAPIAIALSLAAWLTVAVPASAQTCPELVIDLRQRWDEITFQMPADERANAYAALAEDAFVGTTAQPNCTEAWVWNGIAEASYAEAGNMFVALGALRRAHAALTEAVRQDGRVMAGAAHTALAAIYYRSYPWPFGLGDDELAAEEFKQALALAPNDIDANYYYGDYLISEGRYAEARAALQKALAAPPRYGRDSADAGRREQAQALLARIADHN